MNDFVNAHKHSDVNSEPNSLHHTLGKGPNHAAPGNHSHIGRVSIKGTTLLLGYLELNGAILNKVDYPVFFAAIGATTATHTLPNIVGLTVQVK